MSNLLKDLMEFFAKIVKHYIYFSKALDLRSLIEFWISNLSVSTHYLLEWPRTIILHDTYSNIFRHIHALFRHIQPYCAYLEPCVILAYSEPFHIQNPGILRNQDIFRTLSRYILAYSVGGVTLEFWKTCFIQNYAIFRVSALRNSRHIQNPVYLGTVRQVQTYSLMITLTFFLHFFHTFQQDLKRHICFLTTMTSISMLDRVYFNNTQSLIKAL